ncbi:MAG: YlbF family regulator [Clostridium sp.]|nr:YlbF family regulator [Clostridium sp.]
MSAKVELGLERTVIAVKINDALLQLIDAIKASKEYQAFAREKERVKGYPELKERLDEFRWKNFELQNTEEDALEKTEQMEEEYQDIREHPVVSDFLSAELDFCRMMQAVYWELTESMDFE